jgi:hypothetical protein
LLLILSTCAAVPTESVAPAAIAVSCQDPFLIPCTVFLFLSISLSLLRVHPVGPKHWCTITGAHLSNNSVFEDIGKPKLKREHLATDDGRRQPLHFTGVCRHALAQIIIVKTLTNATTHITTLAHSIRRRNFRRTWIELVRFESDRSGVEQILAEIDVECHLQSSTRANQH